MFYLSDIARISYPHQASAFNPFLPTWPLSAYCLAPPPAAPLLIRARTWEKKDPEHCANAVTFLTWRLVTAMGS